MTLYRRRSAARSITGAEAREALERFCARRERAPAEVQRRIIALGLSDTEAQQLWTHLLRERYVDEHRFARAFAHDKLRLERWGRHRIRLALRQRGISESIIEQVLQELDAEEYAEALHQLLMQKRRQYANHPQSALKVRAALYRAGFEPDLIEAVVNSET